METTDSLAAEKKTTTVHGGIVAGFPASNPFMFNHQY
jgi:hypothetical protein